MSSGTPGSLASNHIYKKGAPFRARLKNFRATFAVGLLHRSPDALDVFVVFEFLQEITNVFAVDVV